MIKRNQWTAALLALVLFGCGVVAGVLGHRYYLEAIASNRPSAADMRQQYVAEMKARVHLTSEQVDKLQNILDETKARAKAVRDHYHPEMVKIKEEQISEVKSILTPAQVPEYENLVTERERRYHAQEDHDRRDDRHGKHRH